MPGNDPLGARLFGYGVPYRAVIAADGRVEPLPTDPAREAFDLAAELEHGLQATCMRVVVTVAEVQPDHVDTGLDGCTQLLAVVQGGTEGGDDLRSTSHLTSFMGGDGSGRDQPRGSPPSAGLSTETTITVAQ